MAIATYGGATMLISVAVFALFTAGVALVAAFVALRALSRLRRATTVLAKGADGARMSESWLEATERHIRLTASVAAELDQLRAEVQTTQLDTETAIQAGREFLETGLARGMEDLAASRGQLDAVMARSLRNVALVRYDAFAEMAGRMSFSLALLDDGGDGVTLSAIAGRCDTRVYAKGIRSGTGEHGLSPEETQAVKAAIRSRAATQRRTARGSRRPDRPDERREREAS